jgi:hypothetical protein
MIIQQRCGIESEPESEPWVDVDSEDEWISD